MAIIYDIIYILFAIKLYTDVFENPKNIELYSGVELFTIIFLFYNLFMHAPVFFLNIAIIIKELQLENIQILGKKAGSLYGDNDYSLGHADPYKATENLLWFANPFTWLDIMVEMAALIWEFIRDVFLS